MAMRVPYIAEAAYQHMYDEISWINQRMYSRLDMT
jgi:hypothetical protein